MREVLIIAHPGHELCVYGWLKATRPDVLILTDGSGRSEKSRIDSTLNILSAAGAEPGSLFGAHTDRDFYRALLAFDFSFFERIVKALADILVANRYEAVNGDAAEGYNPIHDVCRALINTAVEIAEKASRRRILNREFWLFQRQPASENGSKTDSLRFELSEDVFAEKLNLAAKYPELKSEVDAALDGKLFLDLSADADLGERVRAIIATLGRDAYRTEYLRAIADASMKDGESSRVTFYDQYGAMLVAAGVYEESICYDRHVRPLIEHLRNVSDREVFAAAMPN